MIAVADVLASMLYRDGPDFSGTAGELYAQAAAQNVESSGQTRASNVFGHGPNGQRVLDMLRVLARHSLSLPKSPWFNTPWPTMDEIKPHDSGWRNLLKSARLLEK